MQICLKICQQIGGTNRIEKKKQSTFDSSIALYRTLNGIVYMIKNLLSLDYCYILPGKFSSDRIEAEFDSCRQSSGGNFLISAEQVVNSIKLRRLKLYAKLDLERYDSTDEDCCQSGLVDYDSELETIEQCFDEASTLTAEEKAALYFICGYICKKESIPTSDDEKTKLFEV